MAKAKSGGITRTHIAKPRKKRPGIHSKSKSSRIKTSKSYKKLYKGQGKKR
jgi:hypothetical protein